MITPSSVRSLRVAIWSAKAGQAKYTGAKLTVLNGVRFEGVGNEGVSAPSASTDGKSGGAVFNLSYTRWRFGWGFGNLRHIAICWVT